MCVNTHTYVYTYIKIVVDVCLWKHRSKIHIFCSLPLSKSISSLSICVTLSESSHIASLINVLGNWKFCGISDFNIDGIWTSPLCFTSPVQQKCPELWGHLYLPGFCMGEQFPEISHCQYQQMISTAWI